MRKDYFKMQEKRNNRIVLVLGVEGKDWKLKVVATADLWVYNAENLCVSFFYQVTSIFHLRGGEIKKSFFGPTYYAMLKKCSIKLDIFSTDRCRELFWRENWATGWKLLRLE